MFPQYTNEQLEYSQDGHHSQSAPVNDAYMGYYHMPIAAPTPQFDATYCSDFTCCGLTIPDLHGLLAHYEDIHCVTFSPDGVHIPVLSPVQSQGSSANSSPRTSFSMSIPPSPVDFAPQGQASAFHNSMFYPPGPISHPSSESSFFDLTPPNILTYGSSLDDALGDNWKPIENKYCSPTSSFGFINEQTPCFVHPSTLIENKAVESRRLSVQNDTEETSSVDAQAAFTKEEQPSDSESQENQSASQPCPTPSTSISPSPAPLSLSNESSSSSLDEPALSTSTGPVRTNKKRKGLGRHTDPADKPYKCPKTGCIKTYLNPNGLTYHLRKGTCEYA